MSSKIIALLSKKSLPKYSDLPRDDPERTSEGGSEKDLDTDSFIPHRITTAKNSRTVTILTILPWVTTVTLACTLFFLLGKISQSSHPDKFGTLDGGWATEFGPAKETIKLEQQRFTGSPYFNLDASIHIPNPTSIRYSGNPTPEMDAAWEELVWGRYFRITEQEGKDAWGDEYLDFLDKEEGGYVISLDMFHTLHCLNQIRKLLYPEYYIDHQGPIHNGHCLDHIRQYIMCAGDLTPIPTRYTSAIDRNFAYSDVTHTCRNFQSARNWLTERANGSTMVKPSHQKANECKD